MEQRSLAKSVTEVRIVEAAAQMFARHGFKAATTREIAQLADLNEVTLFRYFLRKPDLFWAAIESRLGRVKLGRDLQISLAGKEEPSLVVPKLVAFLLDSLLEQPELYRLLHVAAFELPGANKIIREHLGPIFDAVAAYFERCVERGIIHPVEASLPTLGILGTVVAHSNLHALVSGALPVFEDREAKANAYASLWLRALMPDSPSNPDPVTGEGLQNCRLALERGD
ncbi:MAG TPA: TetR/AcrR family transcriptional regulator [Terriglobales bacterium]|nr:TetR/AcrR family transcriptional regulator [Terriglobales bacterium]